MPMNVDAVAAISAISRLLLQRDANVPRGPQILEVLRREAARPGVGREGRPDQDDDRRDDGEEAVEPNEAGGEPSNPPEENRPSPEALAGNGNE